MVVISHQDCILLDHVQYYKNFKITKKWKIPKSIEDLLISIRQKRHFASGGKYSTSLLGGKREKTIDKFRVNKYHEKMSGQTQHSVKVDALGPTSDAAQQHVLWIFHQIQEWRGDYALDPLNWRWQLTKQGIMPMEMTKQVALLELLKLLKYGCKTDCARRNCTCR